MIRLERDPSFWRAVYEHPEVKPRAGLGLPLAIEDVVQAESVLPLASEHGGFLFIRLDGLGRVWELHTLYTPEGWGREVVKAFPAALRTFDWQVLTTYEVESNPRSKPWKRIGFQEAGEFAPACGHNLKTWVLTRQAWRGSCPSH